MESGRKGRTENTYIGCTRCKTVCTTGSVSYFHGKYIKNSKRLTVRATIDLFLMILQRAVL